MVGHTIALRYAEFGYAMETTDAHFGNDAKKKNRWFEAIGALPPLTTETAQELTAEGPERAFAKLNDSIESKKDMSADDEKALKAAIDDWKKNGSY